MTSLSTKQIQTLAKGLSACPVKPEPRVAILRRIYLLDTLTVDKPEDGAVNVLHVGAAIGWAAVQGTTLFSGPMVAHERAAVTAFRHIMMWLNERAPSPNRRHGDELCAYITQGRVR